MHKLLFLLLLLPSLLWGQVDYYDLGITPNGYLRQDKHHIKNCIQGNRFDIRHLLLSNEEDYDLLIKHASKFKNLDSLTIGFEGNFCTYIDQWDNKVLETMPNLPDLPKLRFFSLIVMSVKHLPKNIGEFKNLEFLELSGDYEDIPEGVWELNKLKTLRLYGSYKEVSPKLYQMPNLEVVLLEAKFTSLPKPPKTLNKWIYLSLKGAFKEVPSIVNYCSELRFLSLNSDNPMMVDGKLAQLTHLEQLFIENSILLGISEDIIKLKKLRSLFLGNTYLKKLPKEVFQMESLEELILTQEWIDQIFIDVFGEEYWPIPNLELPEKIPYSAKLQYIDISDRVMTEQHLKQFFEVYGEEVISW